MTRTASIVGGLQYQHLISWYEILALKIPEYGVEKVIVENGEAGYCDDVTIFLTEGSGKPNAFCQIKHHVDLGGQYSTDVFLEKKKGKESHLGKLWLTWKKLKSDPTARPVLLEWRSNWGWDGADRLGGFIQSDCSLKSEFLTAGASTIPGKLRERWREAVGAEEDEFRDFLRCLRFRLGAHEDGWIRAIIDRMSNLGLKHEERDLETAQRIVMDLIRQPASNEVTLEVLEAKLTAHKLHLPKESEASTTVYLEVAKGLGVEPESDFGVYWLDRFEADGRQLKNAEDWNGALLPELVTLEKRVHANGGEKLIKARGYARLSPWLAFGYVFRQVAGYRLEFDHYGQSFRTDAIPRDDFTIVVGGNHVEEGESIEGKEGIVALAIGVTRSVEEQVREYLAVTKEVSALLLLEPKNGFGECIRDAGDCVALAQQVRKLASSFVEKRRATKLLVFYSGPAVGACFIGHRFNAVCKEIQLMEHQQPGYAPSFLLSESNV